MSPELDRELRRMSVLRAREVATRRRRSLRARQEVLLRGGRPARAR
ncbi:hypothetical protein [Cellulomonas edaphi]|uniref:Uncharacterized protein n=1 Tax=Cellulomonas edaphi TaxID=3053468 RepID=A0ABT7S9Y0_9CELL|nr:hypothetical protein [Cellulomons edaphi]MDM7832427.1 hypothetical protein [Cellulomons edaphi]